MRQTIGEFSSITGISIHTLRYYEKEKLIQPDRLANGRRVYSDSDLTWIQFIRRLKDTGMPIREIRGYAALRARGDDTLEERMEMLIRHRTALKEEIAAMQEHLGNLDDKIRHYRSELTNRNP